MKREGWQQGTVRINRSKLLRVAAAANCEETAVGAMAHGKAPVKPTNASKTTGKCRRPRSASCHYHPVSKARDKTKGAHKLHACDVALNHRLVSWRVVDGGSAGSSGIPDYKGTSASSLLAYLAGSGSSWHEDDEDGGSLETAPLVNGGLPDLYDIIVGRRADVTMLGRQEADLARATDIAVGDTDAIEEQEQDSDDVKEDGDEEDMGFCMVGITIAVEFSDGEEDWIVVDEI
ncbi:hypothetical protein SEVIR_3G303200v4 [Setaria viridis]|uniref:Uncharacterized protein n=2 Tax=Setaria TaxID=4554 RepID=K3Z9B3_SETIT|nr:uncharacterized protein LOC101781053 [Setaria italica]XP_034583952.1 uncharacterized protein LOC117846936 [Setaria viridis]RCV18347.1 hypothetical protein SETIT_3G293800v2 [Setaria italica]TKW28103.1 hypothetical protein SEVIR_3G303200v2 [Setaria viridis]